MTREVLLWQIAWLFRLLAYNKLWWAAHDDYGEIG